MTAEAPVAEALRRPRTAAIGGLFALSAVALGVGAALPSAWLFTVAVVATYVLDDDISRREPVIDDTLRRVALGLTVRFAIREMALVLLLLRSGVPEGQIVAVTVALWALHGLRGAYMAFVVRLRSIRKLPAVTRNIDLTALHIPDAPPPLLIHDTGRKLLHLDLPLMAAGCVAGFTGSVPIVVAVVVVPVLAGALASAYMLRQLLRSRHLGNRDRVLAVVAEQVHAYRPEVLLYFSGSRDSAYQINMWLSTAERLDRRALLVMRERANVPRLARTSLPVLCLPSAVDLMNLEMPDVRVAMFIANVGKNIHLLRVPGIKHVFIGHGDSDKTASFNPYSKVYDEVWVAGPAGRERYARAQVGVADQDIVEVGRPQLAEVADAVPRPPDWVPTVLYAPTWEGWTDDVPHTSLILMGPTMVRALLERSPAVRVLYKPHPLTGTRSRAAWQAHETIVSMIREANAERAQDPQWSSAGSAERADAADRLVRLDAELQQDTWTQSSSRADEAEIARDLGAPDPDAVARVERTESEYDAAYWDSQEGWRHRVVVGARPTLYSCFNQSDVLISDISSVVPDFLASGKPYVVTNPGGQPEDEFQAANGSAGAAYLLGPGTSLDRILDAVFGPDPLAAARKELTAYLLGPDHRSSLAQFNAEVERLALLGRAQPPPEELEAGFEPDFGEEADLVPGGRGATGRRGAGFLAEDDLDESRT